MALLSLPWLGLLLVFVRFLSLQLTLWASACVGPHGYPTFSRVGAAPSPGFLFSALVVGGSFHPVHSPLSSFGMWSPFRVISVLCHYWSPTKVSFGGVFLLGGSLPFRSGVVVSLRPLSVCQGSWSLVPALFPGLSLPLPVPIFSWLLLLIRQVLWVCCLTSLWLCAHLQLGRGFLMLPACPSPSFGLLVYWFIWLLFSTRVPYLRDGVTPAGSRIVCPRSERRFGLSIEVRYTGPFLAGPPASVCGYLRARSLRVCYQVVLAVSLTCGSP